MTGQERSAPRRRRSLPFWRFPILVTLEWIGSFWGERGHGVRCGDCALAAPDEPGILWIKDEHGRITGARGNPAFQHYCSACGGHLYAYMPNGLLLSMRWQSWRSDLRWVPHRLYFYEGGDRERGIPRTRYRIWRWLGRDWRRRPA